MATAVHAAKSPPLHQDITTGNIEHLRNHIDQGADLDERDRSGVTPLQLALILKKPEFALELIGRGADINARTPDGATPLMLAADKGLGEVVDLLLDRKALVDVMASGSSPLFGAVRTGNHELFERLVLAGARTDRRNGNGESLLYVAAESGQLALVQRLLDLGADVNVILPDHRTPIFAAIGERKIDVAELLYAHGAAINAADGETGAFLTPLVYRFAAEQEYQKQHTADSAAYLQRAGSAFAAAETLLNEHADEFSHQVNKTRWLNALSLMLGATAANIQASINGVGTQIVMLGSTATPKDLRDKYRNVAHYCGLEAQRMATVETCVQADATHSRNCFTTPSK